MSEAAGKAISRDAALAREETRRRSRLRTPSYAVALFFLVALTPLRHRHPEITAAIGVPILALTALRALPVSGRRGWDPFLAQALALSWGVLSAFLLARFELSWTTFVTELLTCGLAAAEVSALVAQSALAWRMLALLLAAPALVAIFGVGGLRGQATGLFLLGYGALLAALARVQNQEFWARVRETDRALGMLDAIPGWVACLSSDLKLLRANAPLNARLAADEAATLQPLQAFARALFQSGADSRAVEMEGRYWFGQRYGGGREAVLLGIDMSERLESAAELARERGRRLLASRSAQLGEAMAVAARALGAADTPEAKAAAGELLARLAEPDSGEPQASVVDLAAIGSELAVVLGPHCARGGRGIAFVPGESAAGTPVPGIADRRWVERVALTLIQNALDATPEGGKVTISTGRDGMEWSWIAVADDGPGIPEDRREQVFEPLRSTKSVLTGTGAGLSVGRELAMAMDGRLDCEPGPAPGARFVLRLRGA